MAEYTVTVVSQSPPRAWSFTDNKTGNQVQMETHKVKLEGVEGPVEVNKKPGAKITVGDVLNGTLEPNEFSGEGFKFKAAKTAPGGFAPKDQGAIIAEWAIGQAVQLALAFATKPADVKLDKIEANAVQFKQMVDRVKNGPINPTILPAQSKAVTANEDEIIDLGDPVNLEDIPF